MRTVSDTRLAYRTCPLCEATCGLELTVVGGRRRADPGRRRRRLQPRLHLPQGREPRRAPPRPRPAPAAARARGRTASHEPATLGRGVRRGRAAASSRSSTRTARDAVGAYVGNPMGHSLAGNLYLRGYHKTLGTRSLYTVGTVDQHPKSLASALLYGTQFTVAVPDLDRTDAPPRPRREPGRLERQPRRRARHARPAARHPGARRQDRRRRPACGRARRARPTSTTSSGPGPTRSCSRRSRTTLFDEGLVAPATLEEHVVGLDEVRGVLRALPAGARRRGAAGSRRRDPPPRARARRGRARRRLRADRHDEQAFGTAASWLVDVLNVLTGNLDRPGGAMFSTPGDRRPDVQRRAGARPGVSTRALAQPRARPARGARRAAGRRASRRRSTTPGDGPAARRSSRSRATPCSARRTARASTPPSAALDCLVCVDPYLNETTRHAHVILPPPSPLERAHYTCRRLPDRAAERRELLAARPPAVRTTRRTSGRSSLAPDRRSWDGLGAGRGRRRARPPARARHAPAADAPTRTRPSPAATPTSCSRARAPRVGEQRLLDIHLRCGPHGDALRRAPRTG